MLFITPIIQCRKLNWAMCGHLSNQVHNKRWGSGFEPQESDSRTCYILDIPKSNLTILVPSSCWVPGQIPQARFRRS